MNAAMVLAALRQQGVTIDQLCLDSRRVRCGDVFIATRGARNSGHDFIGDAVNRGAAAVIYDAETTVSAIAVPSIAVAGLADLLGDIANLVYRQPSEKLRVVGVTGTNGKTTVSQWIAQTLNESGRRCAVMGTLGNGFLGHLQDSPNTTPDAIAVHSGLADFVAAGATACAMEVSSIGLDQGRVNGVAFDTAVFTNLSRDHLDYHADMEAYAEAKAELFSMSGLKTAVINLDDPFGVELAQRLSGKVRTIGYTLSRAQGADDVIDARDLRMNATGIEFMINGLMITAPVIGCFNAENLLAVFGTLKALGISTTKIVSALATITPPPGRLQLAGGINQPLVVVDYAHTPDALDKALTALHETKVARGGSLICIFGCGGDRDPGKRPMMGAVAERFADQVVVTSDNPRNEDPALIATQIIAGMQSIPSIVLERSQAIKNTISAADARDVILLAGKGHETYQEIAGVKYPFSDMVSAQAALEQRP